MDDKFTEKISAWLSQPANERDYDAGALLLLQLSGNQIAYRNITMRGTVRCADHIEYQLRKYYEFRLAKMTHQKVEQMAKEVKQIASDHIERSDAEQHSGKRADHDKLPDEIKAAYVENYSLLQRMRELHLRLRTLSLEDATCPDSERYPFLKELIKLDKKLHANWQAYDEYPPCEA